MKRLFGVVISVLAFTLTTYLRGDSTTTRLGLTVPSIGSSGYAPKINTDLSLIDTGVAVLGQTNSFTGANTFHGLIYISSAGPGYMPYFGTSGVVSFLSPGTTNYLFRSGGTGAPSWVNPSSLSVSYAATAGSAGSVTNGVYTNGSYADPSWITGLSWTKISGAIPWASTTSTYANPSWITSLAGSKISGTVPLASTATHATSADSATNSTTVTNGIYTTGYYSNPSWLTELLGTKIIGRIDLSTGNFTNEVFVGVSQNSGMSDDFTDGNFSNNPAWVEKNVSSASWSAVTNRAVLTASDSSWSGLLETPITFTTQTVSMTFQATSSSPVSMVYLKSCNTTPTTTGPEAGCYTAAVTMGDNTVLPPPFPPYLATLITLYSGVGSIGEGFLTVAWPGSGLHSLSLQSVGGLVTASYDSGVVIATATNSDFTSFTNIGFGATSLGAAGSKTTSFDDILVAPFVAVNTYAHITPTGIGYGKTPALPLDIVGNGSITGSLAIGAIRPVAVATQTIAAAGTVLADQCGGVKRIDSGGIVTSSTTTTFESIAPGNQCMMAVCNVGSNNISLDYNAGFLTFGASDVLLTPNDCVDVAFDGGVWRQRSPVSVN
jgi:hypothetical protein